MIELAGVTKVYPGGIRALDGVTLTIGTGELVAQLDWQVRMCDGRVENEANAW